MREMMRDLSVLRIHVNNVVCCKVWAYKRSYHSPCMRRCLSYQFLIPGIIAYVEQKIHIGHAIDDDEKVVLGVRYVIRLAFSMVPATNGPCVLIETRAEVVGSFYYGFDALYVACKLPVHPQWVHHEAQVMSVGSERIAVKRVAPQPAKV